LDAAGVGPEAIPLVVTTDGRALSAPSSAEVAAAVGMSTAPVRDFYDLVIVGGGPAGLGAAVYGASEGLHTVLVERRAVGGQAGQASLFFAQHARSVTLVVRGDSLERSMSYYLIQQLAAIDNISVRTRCEVVEAHGTDHLEAVTLCDRKESTATTMPAEHLFVFIGAEPRTEWLDGAVQRDPHGFLYTGPDLLSGGQRPAG